jgi:cbb3-type cytochrome oxidase cytochrome c subunit
MKGFTPLVLGILATLAFSWLGLAYIPDLQIGHLDPQSDEEGTDIYPMPKSGMAERGRRIYVANGCFYCHSEQVRADYAAADIDRKWGDRRSAPRDYIFDRPALLGKMRLGPDLANIGKRAPAEEEGAAATPPPGAANASPAPPNASPSTAANAPSNAASPAPTGAPPSSSPATLQQNANLAQSPNPSSAPGTSPAQSPAAPLPPAQNAAAASPPAQPAPAAGSPIAQAGAAPSPAASPSESPALYSAAWHYQHLYSPRSLNLDSDMPAYKFLFEKERIGGQESADALNLRGKEAPGEGWEIVPTYDTKCLVAYLMSLNQSHPLNEVKSAPRAASPAAAKSPAK